MNRINLMPMAGKGLRFLKANFKDHKPLILINGVHMFIQSGKCMPKANKWIYLYKNISNKKKYLKSKIPFKYKKISKIIYLKENTQGQAETCLLGKKFISPKDQIFIHSCDSYIQYNKSLYYELIKKYDVIIFTSKPTKHHINNINSYGWVRSEKGEINSITCKKKASNEPRKDNVIVGSFAFRKKLFFENSINSLIKKNIKVNNEFYMDMAIKEAINLNYKVVEFVVDNYISWGTPEELKNFLGKKIEI